MRFAETFIADGTDINGKQTQKLIEENKAVPDTYCICLSAASPNILEVVSSRQINTPPFKESDYLVIAFAKGRIYAFELVREIFQAYCDGGGDISAIKKDLLHKYKIIQRVQPCVNSGYKKA